MAPRSTPATSKPPAQTTDHSFDADARATERQAAPITIGEVVYTRRRKDWDVTREMRRLMRVQEVEQLRRERIARELDPLDWDDDRELTAADKRKRDAVLDSDGNLNEDAIAEIHARIDAAADAADEATYALIAALIEDKEGNSPDPDVLKPALDVEDAGDLAASLAGGAEPDPTPTATPTT